MDKFIVFLALIGPCFGLIDGLSRPGRRYRLLSFIGWGSMFVFPGYWIRGSVWPLQLAATAIAAVAYVWWRRRFPYEPRNEATMLFFSSDTSVAISGALAAITLTLFFFSVGLLGHPEDFPRQFVWVLFAVPLVLGCLAGLAKKRLRRRFPNPTPVTFNYSVMGGAGGVHAQRMVSVSGQSVTATGGLMWDELIMAIVLTPVLWPLLSTAYPLWNLFYLYGMIILPTLFVYVGWSTLQRAFLRWTGKVRRKELKLFEAYEGLVLHQQIGPWLGELIIDYDDAHNSFHVAGTLPERHLLASLTRRLTEMGAAVDTSRVTVDPAVAPNPWFELALARRQRQ